MQRLSSRAAAKQTELANEIVHRAGLIENMEDDMNLQTFTRKSGGCNTGSLNSINNLWYGLSELCGPGLGLSGRTWLLESTYFM